MTTPTIDFDLQREHEEVGDEGRLLRARRGLRDPTRDALVEGKEQRRAG